MAIVKVTESATRITLIATFENGEKLRLNLSAFRESMSGTIPVTKPATRIFFNWAATRTENETPLMQAERVAKLLKTTANFDDAIAYAKTNPLKK